MRHAEDPLLAADRIVRRGLGVRDGQTIRDRAREILEAQSEHYTRDALAASHAVLDLEGWPGIEAAAKILACSSP